MPKYSYDCRVASSMPSSLDVVKNEWVHTIAMDLDKIIRDQLRRVPLGTSSHLPHLSPVLTYTSAKVSPVQYAIEVHFAWQGDAVKADVYVDWDQSSPTPKTIRKSFTLAPTHSPATLVGEIGFWIAGISGG
jgi:hypothetical protein